ncbi:hypothetical protein [Parabacteroides merdae]|uniref:hypothetical protein n=1 Tax=Parabacteroides merdae TaxID=46503 RepID=UPI001C21C17D|nr:hypothetical protein [Parabacteroides merdae]MBU9059520.1 hypothetical protein [Parabacteroides merdae]MCG4835585.1 hypothetical protein [Parabacteroides merdae]MCQ5193790.1 hypothetical protein [Parabacteroides merdae]
MASLALPSAYWAAVTVPRANPSSNALLAASNWRRLLISSWMLTASCWLPRLMAANASLLSAISRW